MFEKGQEMTLRQFLESSTGDMVRSLKKEFKGSSILISFVILLTFWLLGNYSGKYFFESVDQSLKDEIPFMDTNKFGSFFYQESEDANLTIIYTVSSTKDLSYETMYTNIKSICYQNDIRIKNFYILQNGKADVRLIKVLQYFEQVKYLALGKVLSEVQLADYAIRELVKTQYYYLSDIGWKVVFRGIAAYSIRQLEKNPNLLQVEFYLSEMDGYYWNLLGFGGPLQPSQVFTWNPTIRRLKDYQLIGKGGFASLVSSKDAEQNQKSSKEISRFYKSKGYYNTVSPSQLVRSNL